MEMTPGVKIEVMMISHLFCNRVPRKEPRRKSRGKNDDVVVYSLTLKPVLSRTKITMLRKERESIGSISEEYLC
jgi:hypothetical protein